MVQSILKTKLKIKKRDLPLIILIFFGALLFYVGIANHYLFKTFTYDYANYNFAFWDYAHFRISPLPTFRGNFLQDHFSFTLMYFIPVYWLLNWLTGTYTLIIIQNALILFSAWYSYKFIKLKTDNPWLTSGIMLYFFLLFGRYSAFGTDVNLAIMSAAFVPVFLYYFEVKRYLIASVILILSLLSRENMPLWFIFIFIVLILDHWKERQAVLFSIGGIIISVTYFVLLFKLFIQMIETPDVEYALFNYSALGEGPGEAISYILRNPVESVKLFFINHLENPEYDKVKLEFYLVYLISGGFVLLLRPKYLIWFIPVVAQKVLNDDFFRWGLATYYSTEIVTLMPLSVFLVLTKIKPVPIQKILVILSCAGSLGMTIHKMDSSNHEVPWTFYKSKINFYSHSFYQVPFDIKKVNRLLTLIPKNARVSASNVITPHLAQREYIYFFPTVKDAEYIVFSVLDDNYLMSADENEKHREQYLNSPEWRIVAKEYPVFLLQRKNAEDDIVENYIPGKQRKDTLVCSFELIDTLKNHFLFSNFQKADTISHLSEQETRSKKYSICLNAQTPYSHGIKVDNINLLDKLEGSVWIKGSSNNAWIVLDNRMGHYRSGNAVIANQNGWEQIAFSHRIPENIDRSNLIIYLWNSGSEPVYYDDLKLILTYK